MSRLNTINADSAGMSQESEMLTREVGDFYAWSRDYWIDLARRDDATPSGMLTFGLWSDGCERMYDAQEALRQLVVTSLGTLPPGALGLDIGCGIGGAAIALVKEKPVRLVCMDLVPDQLRIGQELARRAGVGDRLEFRTGSSMNMPFDDQGFDFSYCIESSFHYPDKLAFLRENYRVLKPGAVAVLADITCEDNSLVAFRRGNFFKSVEEMRELILAAGFSLDRIISIGDRVFWPLLAHVERFNAGRRDKLRRYWTLVLRNYARLFEHDKMDYGVYVLRKAASSRL